MLIKASFILMSSNRSLKCEKTTKILIDILVLNFTIYNYIVVEKKKYIQGKVGGVYRPHGIALCYYYDVIGSKRCRSFLFSGSEENSNNNSTVTCSTVTSMPMVYTLYHYIKLYYIIFKGRRMDRKLEVSIGVMG